MMYSIHVSEDVYYVKMTNREVGKKLEAKLNIWETWKMLVVNNSQPFRNLSIGVPASELASELL